MSLGPARRPIRGLAGGAFFLPARPAARPRWSASGYHASGYHASYVGSSSVFRCLVANLCSV
jgi:hypothetical protein